MTTKRVTVIGSRETPLDIFRLTITFTNILAELGYAIYSGGCPEGMDRAALIGAYRHKTSDKSRNRIYLAWNGMAELWHNPEEGFYDAKRFPCYQQAHELAKRVHTHWERLKKGGIAMHNRNPFQVLGDDLASPTDFVVCWAPPVGKLGHVKGGTATAVAIALENNIPVFNLYYPEVEARVREIIAAVRRHYRMQAHGVIHPGLPPLPQ